ncbi:hypothetical protein OGAPHI_005580 [Ogataea philodendri]|uniref:Uncharacterized protein n=1 Tax=Ogataea philodendri TaxID=1378263 RepID=A0A9P8T1N7_9ASCO|nr:uncharacterized protein OGAPHI_005580 [Ogataea philodendri]KAH3662329.1 hypothetical protein OGAPHI_005580 [Ogataea philodendri]
MSDNSGWSGTFCSSRSSNWSKQIGHCRSDSGNCDSGIGLSEAMASLEACLCLEGLLRISTKLRIITAIGDSEEPEKGPVLLESDGNTSKAKESPGVPPKNCGGGILSGFIKSQRIIYLMDTGDGVDWCEVGLNGENVAGMATGSRAGTEACDGAAGVAAAAAVPACGWADIDWLITSRSTTPISSKDCAAATANFGLECKIWAASV